MSHEEQDLVGMTHEVWAMAQSSPAGAISDSIDLIIPILRSVSLEPAPSPDRQELVTWALAKAKEHLARGGMEVTAERFLLVAKALTMPPPKLWIASAAINAGGLIFSLARPARHSDIIRAMSETVEGRPLVGVQGFVTNDGRFLGRKEAAKLAFESGQIAEFRDELFTEDLW